MGAQLVKEVASKTGDLARRRKQPPRRCLPSHRERGPSQCRCRTNPMDLKRGIDKAVSQSVEGIKAQSQEVDDDIKKIENVARVSANNDEQIGRLIAEAMEKVKKEASSPSRRQRVRKQPLRLWKAWSLTVWLHLPLFRYQQPREDGCEMDSPYILLYDKERFSNLQGYASCA